MVNTSKNREINLFPKGEIKSLIGKPLVLKGDDIDTDRIIPARFLKCVSFNNLGNQVFADDRAELKGKHPFDLISNQGASLLIVNDNFGCGSSREHAPQALMRWGIRGIIGESFAEIFFGNCLALGIPCVTTEKHMVSEIQQLTDKNEENSFEINLVDQIISNEKYQWPLEINKGAKEMLITGRWDATSQLISNKIAIDATMKKIPYLNDFKKG